MIPELRKKHGLFIYREIALQQAISIHIQPVIIPYAILQNILEVVSLLGCHACILPERVSRIIPNLILHLIRRSLIIMIL